MSGFIIDTWGPNCKADEFPGTGFESSTREDVNYGGIGGEVVVTEGLVLGEEEEAEGKVGIVFELEGNLGELERGETGWEEGEDGGPARLGAIMGEDGGDGGDWVGLIGRRRSGVGEGGRGEEIQRNKGFFWGSGKEMMGFKNLGSHCKCLIMYSRPTT